MTDPAREALEALPPDPRPCWVCRSLPLQAGLELAKAETHRRRIAP